MRTSRLTIRRIAIDYAVAISVWLSLSLLTVWQENNLAVEEHFHIYFREMLLLYAVRYFTLALLTPPIFYIVERAPIGSGHILRRSAAYLAAFVPFSIVFACIRWSLMPNWMPDTHWQHRSAQTFIDLIYGMFADELGAYLAIVTAAHAYSYFIVIKRQELERSELRRVLAQSELQTVRAQIHPHFLFNTLHGIGTLIQSDPVCARSMILTLSSLLRRALRQSPADLVPFHEDLQLVEEFLDLEKMRLGCRLSVQWAIDPQTSNLLVPRLILLPLVENAIKHGVACYREGGSIEIMSGVDGDLFFIEIRNSVRSIGSVETGAGLGHQGVRTQLRYLYNGDAKMTFDREGQIAVARLTLPCFPCLQEELAAT